MTEGAPWIVVTDEMQFRAVQRGTAERVHGTDGRPDRHVFRPKRVEVKIQRADEPELYARVEVSPGGTRLSELRLSADDPDRRGVRQSDLRNVDFAFLLEDCVAAMTLELDPTVLGPDPAQWPARVGQPAERDVVRLARLLRRGRQRELNPKLLERVAEVYRANIHGAPTKAVQQEFQVSPRMATEYVSRARKRGHLPPTKQGKKNA